MALTPESFRPDALENVADDEPPELKVAKWAEDELIEGGDPLELSIQLQSAGWSTEQADELVEAARLETRKFRGIQTREDVVSRLDAKYRRDLARLRIAIRAGIFVIVGLIVFLVYKYFPAR